MPPPPAIPYQGKYFALQAMRVRLLNNEICEVDESDVTYLFQQTRLNCAAIHSESIFTMFEAYMKRHSLNYDPEPIDEWDGNFIAQITSIETLRHLTMLAKRTSQAALLELCHERFAQLQVSDSNSDTESDGDGSDHNNDGSGNSGGDGIGRYDSDGDDSDPNNDDSGNSGGDDSAGDDSDGSNSGEHDSAGDDSNSGNGSDGVDDLGNQVEDLSDQELSVCGSDDAGNLSVEVSSSTSNDMSDPEVSRS